jgi:hypothetical protein
MRRVYPLEPDTSSDTLSAATLGGLVFVLSSLSAIRSFVVEALGIGGVLAPLVLSITLLGIAFYMTRATRAARRPAAGFAHSANESRQYLFTRLTRRCATVGAVIASGFVVAHLHIAIQELNPLPLDLTGVVTEPASGIPVEGATLRIESADGVDLTAAESLVTDSRGVFLVRARAPVRRTARLLIYREGCRTVVQHLWQHFQITTPPDLSYVDKRLPFFQIIAPCER